MTGNDVKHVRVTVLKWSQARLASELGMTATSVYRMETGRQKIEKVTELAIRWLVWKESMIECDFSSPNVLPGQSINQSIHDVCTVPGDEPIRHVYKTTNDLSAAPIFSNNELIALLCDLSQDFAELTSEQRNDAIERFNVLFYSLDDYPLATFIDNFYVKLSPLTWLNRRSLVDAWRKFSGNRDFHIS